MPFQIRPISFGPRAEDRFSPSFSWYQQKPTDEWIRCIFILTIPEELKVIFVWADQIAYPESMEPPSCVFDRFIQSTRKVNDEQFEL